MGIDESDITRLLAGDVASDDAQLGQVSSFLGDLKAACPPRSVSALEDHHLAVVVREVRTVGAARVREHRDEQRSRKRLRRTLAAFGAGLLTVLTAGAGVASAMGLNPLEFVPGLVAKPTTPNSSALVTTPSGVPGNSQQASPGTQPPSADPSVPPTTAGQPKPSASATHGTAGNCGNGKGAGNATCTKGNSGKDNSGNGKSNGKSGNGNSGASSTGKSGSSGSGKSGSNGSGKATTAPGTGNGKAKGSTTDSGEGATKS